MLRERVVPTSETLVSLEPAGVHHHTYVEPLATQCLHEPECGFGGTAESVAVIHEHYLLAFERSGQR